MKSFLWGKRGGSESPTSRSFVPLCLLTLTLHCVVPVFRLIKRIRNPGLTVKLCQNLTFFNILVHFLAFALAGGNPMKVITGHDLRRKWIEGISKFTGSNTGFPARVQIYVFLLPKFSFKHWWMLNGNFKTLLGKCFWLKIPSSKQQTIACFISAPASRPLPPHVLPGRAPLSPSTFFIPDIWRHTTRKCSEWLLIQMTFKDDRYRKE